MKREAGEHRAPGPPPSCSTSHLAVRAGPAVESAGACTCPPRFPCPHAEKIITKYRARAHAERWLQHQQQPWIVFTTQSTRAAQPLEERTTRAHSIFKRTIIHAQCLMSPRGCLLHLTSHSFGGIGAVFSRSVTRCCGAQL